MNYLDISDQPPGVETSCQRLRRKYLESLVDTALRHVRGGHSVIPLSRHKKPFEPSLPHGRWKEYQSRLATESEILSWGDDGMEGLGVIGGNVSGGLLCIDFDDALFYQQWREIVGDNAKGLAIQKSGRVGGGYHCFFNCSEFSKPIGNGKLAEKIDPTAESGFATAIDLKGEGGYG